MKPLKVAVAGAGAIGIQHLDSLSESTNVEIISLVDKETEKTRAIANRYGIKQVDRELDDVLKLPELEAVILCTPTPRHAEQAIACLQAGKHVLVEIPLAQSLADAETVALWQQRTGLIAMCAHTRRFNAGHSWLHDRIVAGQFSLRQLDVQTHFLRRSNTNIFGEPRSWTDHLLWHHAAHTVDLFQYQTGEDVIEANLLQGPIDPALQIALDMSIQLKSTSGALCTLSLSFNNAGPQGSTFRYIGDGVTFIARNDALTDGNGNNIELGHEDSILSGITRQDHEFFSAIRESRMPNASVAGVLPCYRMLQRLEMTLT
ncbi:myo-inositol 2-dehydrogenase [Caballeronia temeraria]|uniref:Myo-inositol 2-dehydrogenase n=1 Tax=Caballeronia temeraria TaxID=1777137 RepID=A0A158CAG5_9BURK|nr:Gfo/Idh/MocA family oxidoreductase [Caballeronia temeraria]SAK79345.1 myo-inositol 2-dehydrogenase [Caballeronia temeraria]